MRHTLSLFVWLGFINLLLAQTDWNFNHITPDDGLSTGTVNCVFKDSKGFIWIGTIDGLNRYDGYELSIFKNDSDNPKSITGNIITSISEDNDGNIWIGTRNSGISLFDWNTESFSNLNNIPAFLSGQIRSIHRVSNNQMLIGIDGGGLVLFDLETQEPKQFLNKTNDANSLSNDNVLFITRASKNEYWVSSLSNSIDKFNVKTGHFSHITYDSKYDQAESTRKVIFQDSKGLLWVGLDGKGLVKINPRTGQQYLLNTDNSGLTSNIITAFYEDDKGKLFIGTDGRGINVYERKSEVFSYIRSSLLDQKSLSSDAIYQIYEDNSGVVWVSTFRGGVNTYSPYRTKFKHYKQIPFENNSLSFASVIDVLESEDGYIWIGTDGGGLDRLNISNGSFKHFKHDPANKNTMSTNVAIALEEDSNGNLWIGTYAGGVNRFDREKGIFTRFLPDPTDPSSINSKNVWHIIEDSRGTMWFGLLNGGLDKFNPETESFTHYIPEDGSNSIGSNLIFTLLEDSQSNFWIGTENAGLDLFDRDSETFTHYTNDPSDSTTVINNNIRALFEDSDGKLWVGTSGGISIMDVRTKQLSPARVNKLLPSLVVNGIQEDKYGNLWISTNKGLSKYNPKTNAIQNFFKSDGLQGNEFNYTTSTVAKNGTMYFGGVNGLNAFHPSEVKMSSFKPNVVITDIKLFDQSINGLEENESNYQRSIQSIEQLELRHDQNVLEINFASLDFTSSKTNKYRYKLEGFDQDWTYVDSRKRSASYTNLDPGSYNFNVEGTNSDGIWSPNSRKLDIIVLSPWWQTWWFRLIILLLILTVIMLFVKKRSQVIDKQKQLLRTQIQRATAKTEEQNKNLQAEQEKLEEAIQETNAVVNEAVESGNFSARINLDNKSGAWKDLSESINLLFDSIVIPFQNINEIVGAMASSNLTVRYEGESKGDILKLTSSLNYALDNLASLIATVKESIATIGSESEEMRLSSQEMNNGTAEIAASTSEMNSGAQEQVVKIDEASNELEKIKELSFSVGDQATTINKAASNGVTLSTEGASQMNSMETSMASMISTSGDTEVSIEGLIVKSEEIAGILNSIKEISVETNMLALNAAIEAAKAGDAGRGFAVVADQIRRLAENSNQFTHRIEIIVEEVRKSVDIVNKSVVDMKSDIEETAKISQNVSQSFASISDSYGNTFDLSKDIVSLTEEQFSKVKEVVHLMEGLVVIAEESAAGTEQISSSSNELSAGMADYQEKTLRVSQIIDLLNEKMEEFKLN